MNDRIDYLKDKVSTLTMMPGVYLMKDNTGKIIYVGKAKALKNRVSSYFRENAGHNEKVRQMVLHVYDFDYIVTDSEFEALVLECSLIKQYNPKYNILLKDGKGYHYIKVSEEPFPRITAEKMKSEDGQLLGPYTSSFVVRQAVDEANKIFQLPTCHRKFPQEFKKARPCLNYHIKQCMGVCRGKVSKEEYRQIIEQAVDFIKKGNQDTVAALKQQMETAAEELNFELAAQLRDRITAIERVSASQKVILSEEKEQDVIAFAQNYHVGCASVLKFRGGRLVDKDDIMLGDILQLDETKREFLTQYYSAGDPPPKLVVIDDAFEDMELVDQYFTGLAGKKVRIFVPQKGEQRKLVLMALSNANEKLLQRTSRTGKEVVALDELGKMLGLVSPPDYIEAYDISNMGESARVAGMVTFVKGKPYRAGYKRFAIKGFEGQDDYASMQEVIRRRFNRYFEEKDRTGEGFGRLPDLILLDGGKGHVAAVLPVIAEFGLSVPVFGMVKDSKHRTRAIAKDGGEISFSSKQAAFHFVTNVQDEVHRFAISYQQKVHSRESFALKLRECEGIGEKKAAALLKAFRSKSELKAASVEQLAEAAKLSPEKAAVLQKFIAEKI